MAEETPVLPGSNRRFGSQRARQWLLFVGDCRELGDALAKKPYTPLWMALSFVDALLRGYGQIVFANNPITGLLFLIGLSVADPFMSLAGLVTGSVGLLTSLAIMQPREAIRAGATVYCSILIGLNTSTVLPALYGLDIGFRYWMYMIVGAIFAVYMTSALTNLLGSMGRPPLPCFAVPFVTVQIIVFLCVLHSPSYTSLSNQNVSSIHRMRRDLSAENVNYSHTNASDIVNSTPSIDLMDVSSEITEQPLIFITTEEQNESNNTNQVSEEVVTSVMDNLELTLIPQNDSLSNSTFENRNGSNLSLDDVKSENNSDVLGGSQDQNIINTVKNVSASKDVAEVINGTHVNERLQVRSEGAEKHINQTEPVLVLANGTNRGERTTEVDLIQKVNFMKPDESPSADGNGNTNIAGKTYNVHNQTSIPGTELRNGSSGIDMEPSKKLHDSQHVDWGQVFTGVVLSMTQVFGACHAPAAALMFLGLLIFSPTTGLMCLLGAILSTLTGIVFSPPPYTDVYNGVWGFNGLLCAGAMGGFCFVFTPQSAVLGLFCALFATCLQNVLNILFSAVPMPVMSVPFNISALLFLCVSTADVSSGLVRPDCLTFPEKHRQDWRANIKDDIQDEDFRTVEPPHEKEEEAEQQKKLTLEDV